MKIYYIEYNKTVKFFNGEKTLEIPRDKILEKFLRAVYKKYGNKIKFLSLI